MLSKRIRFLLINALLKQRKSLILNLPKKPMGESMQLLKKKKSLNEFFVRKKERIPVILSFGRLWFSISLLYAEITSQEKILFLKLMFAIFLFFHQMIALKNDEKCFLFHLKSYYRSHNLQVFIYSIPPFSLSVITCEGDGR